jgi:hypothetical protein
MRGLMDRMGIASVNAVVNFIHPPAVVSFHCENILELGDAFLQFLGFFGVLESSEWGGSGPSIGAIHMIGSQRLRVLPPVSI